MTSGDTASSVSLSFIQKKRERDWGNVLEIISKEIGMGARRLRETEREKIGIKLEISKGGPEWELVEKCFER